MRKPGAFHLRPLLLIALGCTVPLGCNSRGGDDDETDRDADPGHDAGVEDGEPLQVVAHEALEAWQVGEVAVHPDQIFVVVDLQVWNRTGESLPLAPLLFWLRTADALEYFGDPLTSLHADGCPENASLAADGDVRCTLVFQIPASAEAASVWYRPVAASGTSYEASDTLSTTACTICGGDCVYLDRDPEHCGACRHAVGLGTCESGEPVCVDGAQRCRATCVDLASDRANCGSCGNAVPVGGSCQDGEPTCGQQETRCDYVCADLDTSTQHCGGCDQAVPAGGSCVDGEIRCDSPYELCDDACVDLWGDDRNCGACGQVCPVGFDCRQADHPLPSGCVGSFEGEVGVSCTAYCEDRGATCEMAGYFNDVAGEWFDLECWELRENYRTDYMCWCSYVP